MTRAYDNGIAFRYVDTDKTARVSDENTAYIVPDGTCRWQLPTAWDDTKFICGEPGESAVIARR